VYANLNGCIRSQTEHSVQWVTTFNNFVQTWKAIFESLSEETAFKKALKYAQLESGHEAPLEEIYKVQSLLDLVWQLMWAIVVHTSSRFAEG